MNSDISKSAQKAPIWGLIFASAPAGIAGAYSMAPYHYWPLLLLALGGFFLIQMKLVKNWHSFLSGWIFGFCYFAFSLSWIGNAFLVEGNEYAWAWPLAVSGLPALLAFFPATACYLAKRFYGQNHLGFYLSLAALLTLFELLRGYVFTGFPWNLFGYSWGGNLEMLQIIHFGNIYWLTALTLFWGLGLGYALTGKKRGLITLSCIIISMASVYYYGHSRLQNQIMGEETNISIKMVQPNVDQAAKWTRDKMAEHFSRLLNLSMPNGNERDVTFIIWPETATNYLFLNNEFTHSQIRDVLQSYSGDVYLIAGALLRDDHDGLPSNSMIVMNKNTDTIHRYDKSHLVPFGEYIPFKEWIPLETVSGFSGFKRGDGRTSIAVDNKFSFSPLICYEILFPSRVVDPQNKADAIINVTNDAWYGMSAGPHQHYLLARIRAIEEALPVIRVANTGFSGIFDSYGKNLAHIDWFKTESETINFYKTSIKSKANTYPDTILFISLLLSLLFLFNKLGNINISVNKN